MIVHPPPDPAAVATDQAAPPTSGQRGIPLRRTIVSLRHRDFRWLLLGQLASTMAQWSDTVTRGWVAYQLTGSALALGSVTATRAVPLLFFSLLGGVLADRFDRKKQILLSRTFSMAADGAMCLLIVTGHLELWQLFGSAFVAGCAHSFMMPARQALIPSLVPRSDLMNAIALNAGAMSVSRALGPAVAGLLLALYGGAAAYLGQVVLHFVSGLGVSMLRVPFTPPAGPRDSVWLSVKGGLRYAYSTPAVLLLLLFALVPMIVAQPYSSLLPIFAEQILQIGPSGLGLLVSASGVGAIVGVVTMAIVGDMSHKGLLVVGGVVLFGLSLAIFALSGVLLVSLVALFFAGLASSSYHAPVQHLIQTNTPDHLRGRVMSIYLLDRGLTPLGAFLMGATADLLSTPTAVLLGGGSCALLALLMAWRRPGFLRLA